MTYGTVQKKVQEWLDLNDPNQRRLSVCTVAGASSPILFLMAERGCW
ncbi:hypothetical protein MesoLjLa_66690 (plasmid) [Mesorhizobium sp. L-2-11]|nr:hypothetical protein MesoLjLa_66690 [Mesorhizobium sp. L-2-11]